MEHNPTQGMDELRETYEEYEDLSPLGMKRSIYLNYVLFPDELGLNPRWDPRVDTARKEYSQSFADTVNSSIEKAIKQFGDVTQDEIKEMLVGSVIYETGKRWQNYASLISGTIQEESLPELLANHPGVTTDLVEKTVSIRKSLDKFLEGYGGDKRVKSSRTRAEFLRVTTVLDSGREALFVRDIRNNTSNLAA